MKIPRMVKICSHKVKVRQVKTIKDNLGYADLNHNEIVISREYDGKALEESTRTEVFLHEVVHQIDQLYGIGLSEQKVRQIAAGLLQVIRDNKIDLLSKEE